MKNIVAFMTRITLLAAIVVGLVVGSGAVPAFAKKKAPTTPASSEASTMAENDQPKPEGKQHKEKKHHKEKKSATESSDASAPKQQ